MGQSGDFQRGIDLGRGKKLFCFWPRKLPRISFDLPGRPNRICLLEQRKHPCLNHHANKFIIVYNEELFPNFLQISEATVHPSQKFYTMQKLLFGQLASCVDREPCPMPCYGGFVRSVIQITTKRTDHSKPIILIVLSPPLSFSLSASKTQVPRCHNAIILPYRSQSPYRERKNGSTACCLRSRMKNSRQHQ